jgi:hypothetical protein
VGITPIFDRTLQLEVGGELETGYTYTRNRNLLKAVGIVPIVQFRTQQWQDSLRLEADITLERRCCRKYLLDLWRWRIVFYALLGEGLVFVG